MNLGMKMVFSLLSYVNLNLCVIDISFWMVFYVIEILTTKIPQFLPSLFTLFAL
jgi:hypothetical protein